MSGSRGRRSKLEQAFKDEITAKVKELKERASKIAASKDIEDFLHGIVDVQTETKTKVDAQEQQITRMKDDIENVEICLSKEQLARLEEEADRKVQKNM